MAFTALMLRVRDLAMLNVERVKQSWKDDDQGQDVPVLLLAEGRKAIL